MRFAPCGFGFHRIPRAKSGGRQIHPDWYLGTNLSTVARLHPALRRHVGAGLELHRGPAHRRARALSVLRSLTAS